MGIMISAGTSSIVSGIRGGRSIPKHIRRYSSSKHPNGFHPSTKILIQLVRSVWVEYETWGCYHGEFGVTGPKICVSVYILRRYERGRLWLFLGGPTGMEVVVTGGHLIVGFSNQNNTTTIRASHVVPYRDVGGWP